MSETSNTLRPTDRHGAILRRLLRGPVTVAGLSRDLGVSEVSIRRDLEELEGLGLLRRVRGGAEPIARPGQVSLFDARLLENTRLKQGIGQVAAGLIRPGDALLLDSGTTVLEVARHIPRPLLDTGGLTILTRSLVIAAELRPYRHVQLIVLGGKYLHDFDDFVGIQVENALADVHVQTLFIGTDGVSRERGLTTDNVLEAGLYRAMARTAERVVVVTDSSKIGLDKLQSTLNFDDVHTFVTDTGAPAGFTRLLQERGIEVILAPAG